MATLPLLSPTAMIEDLSERTGWTKSDIRAFMAHFQEGVEDYLSNGYRVKIAGVLIEPKVRNARKKGIGRNLKTGEPIEYPAKPASVYLKARPVKPLTDISLPSVKKIKSLTAA